MTQRISPAISRMSAAWRGAAHPHTRLPTGPWTRSVSHRNRDRGVQRARTALGALAAGAQCARQSRRTRHDDRRRSPRLLQGAGPAHGRLRPVPHGLSGLARQGDLPSDHAQEPLRDPGICRRWSAPSARPPDASTAAYGEAAWTPIRYVNRAYSRSVLAGLYRSARVGLVTPLARRHEPRREGIRRRPGSRGSRCPRPVALRGRGGGVDRGASGQPLRSGSGRHLDCARPLDAARGTASRVTTPCIGLFRQTT